MVAPSKPESPKHKRRQSGAVCAKLCNDPEELLVITKTWHVSLTLQTSLARMATRESNNLIFKSSEDSTPSTCQLSRDDLCSILRRQLHNRNVKFTQPDFQRLLAEDIATTKIGSFFYGERLLARPEDPELRAQADKFDMIESPEHAYRMTGGPVETMENPCSCTDLTGLTVEGVHLSGSKLEGSDVSFNGSPLEWSDIDVMLQLGPVEMVNKETGRSSVSVSQTCSGVTAVSEPVHQKGFFLLYHKRLPSCCHRELQFSGFRLRKKLLNVIKMTAFAQGRVHDYTFEGPSVASTDHHTSADMVTCISFPSWPSVQFASRSRPSGHPSPALVSRLCRTAALLVPVGSAGSSTKKHEWRLSFSRHEFLTHRAMPRILRDCLVVLKYANAVINGPHGSIKGFQLKTSVLWLAELHSEASLERRGFYGCLLMVLQFVYQSAVSVRLDCYFWTEINLLGGRTEEDLMKLRNAVDLLKKHLETALRVLVAVFVRYNESGEQDARLPSRNFKHLWEFMFPETMMKLAEHKRESLNWDVNPVPGTWLWRINLGKLFSSRSAAKPLYDRVLQKMEPTAEAEREQAARQRESPGLRWTDEC